MKYKPTIGLEIHSQLKTETKMFCDSLNNPYESHPNVNICPVCMGHPGTLPVPNKKAIEYMVRVGYALNSEVARESKFDRKNYFYPDLPKGYQISQYDTPFCAGGYIDIPVEGEHGEEFKRIEIERVHLEEDTGRLVHSEDGNASLVDYNRAGIPLMELVTKPVVESGEEARKFAEELQLILRYLGASDADMEKGQMRVEVNISLRPTSNVKGQRSKVSLGTKVELKNLNSLRAVGEATAYEINRQTHLLEEGEEVIQETRGWDEEKQETFEQRTKEEAEDYRYFPEPDIPPIVLDEAHGFNLGEIEASLPELPQVKLARFVREYNLGRENASVLINYPDLADYYERVVSEALNWAKPESDEDREKVVKLATNYTVKNLRTHLQEKTLSIADLQMTAENFGELIHLIHKGDLSSAGAREVLEEMINTGSDPSNIVEDKGLKQVSDKSAVEEIAEEVINDNPEAANDYRNGKEDAIKFLVGQVMAKSKGAANPQVAQEVLKEKLER